MKKISFPIVTALLFSGSFVAAKYTTFDLSPINITFLRYVIAMIFLTLYIPFIDKSKLKIKRKDLLKVILTGVFGIIGYHLFFFSSLKYTAVTNTGVINAFSPVVTGLLASLFLKERLTKINYLGILLSLIGVLILITKGKLIFIFILNFNIGDILMLMAVLSWAIYSLIIKKLSKKYSSFTITYYSAISGVTILLFLSIFQGGVAEIANISSRSIYSILYMGIFASGIGYLMYNKGIKSLGPTKTSSLVYSIVPVFVAILSYLFFKEKLTIPLFISILLIILGLNAVLHSKTER